MPGARGHRSLRVLDRDQSRGERALHRVLRIRLRPSKILIWNILGAVIFWGSIYATNHCSKQVSTYIFVSLIIKFVLTVNAIRQQKLGK